MGLPMVEHTPWDTNGPWIKVGRAKTWLLIKQLNLRKLQPPAAPETILISRKEKKTVIGDQFGNIIWTQYSFVGCEPKYGFLWTQPKIGDSAVGKSMSEDWKIGQRHTVTASFQRMFVPRGCSVASFFGRLRESITILLSPAIPMFKKQSPQKEQQPKKIRCNPNCWSWSYKSKGAHSEIPKNSHGKSPPQRFVPKATVSCSRPSQCGSPPRVVAARSGAGRRGWSGVSAMPGSGAGFP